MDYLEYARKTFAEDKFATNAAGIIIEAADVNYAMCSLETDSRHMNASNAVMGGAIFTLADFAFAVASNVGNTLTVSLTSQITYLRPCFGGKLTAEARCIKSGKTACSFLIDITDDSGNLVASVATTGCRTDKKI